jgi:type VI secretion system protein ImpL
MFRLFDIAARAKASEDKFQATFALGGRSAAFSIQTGSVLNPFTLPELSAFKCPDKL